VSKIKRKLAKAAKNNKTSVADKLSDATKSAPATKLNVTEEDASKKYTDTKAVDKGDPPPAGHNNPPVSDEDKDVKVGGTASKQLEQFIKAVEAIDDEKKYLDEDKKDIFTHAKDTGFDVKTMRTVIALRRRPKEDRDAAQELVDQYMFALGDR